MGKAKRKHELAPHPREGNGRQQRPSAAEREEARLMKLHAERLQVMRQPHRRMNIDQRCENPLGRFVIALRLAPELYDAGQEYAGIVRSHRRLMGLPGVLSNGPGSGHRCEDADIAEKVERLRVRSRDAYSAMRPSDARITKWLCVEAGPSDDVDLNDPAAVISLTWGLNALAVHFGMKTTRRMA